ncbi:hypothetical protein BDW66DRAFT_150287 [Aspergillus desertorum]
MCAFQADAGKFFTFWIVVNVTTLCFLSFFRSIGANCNKFGNASKISGFLTTIMMIYTGYLIPFEKMHVWFRWIFWINPASYAFESVMGNEFGGLTMTCDSPQFVPYGDGYSDARYRGCTIAGSSGGEISGPDYIHAQYNYSIHHVWRGFGVVVGMWLFFAVLTAFGFERLRSQGSSSYLVFKRGSHGPRHDEEEGDPEDNAAKRGSEPNHNMPKQAIFTWDHLDYYVNYQGQKLQLLNQAFGFVKPGSLVALMGCSGAGKTTLLDVLAQRKDSGEITGSILVNRKAQNISFQRTTGYCEQLDVHEPSVTEKIDYVDKIIDLLELGDISDALIGTSGAGLSIEQRKRLTLGVELVAKPSLLLLEEPASGLDGQSAFNNVRFMRKLADASQAVLVGTTHSIHSNGRGIQNHLDYFARNGAPCSKNANPAEHIVDVVQGRLNPEVDWNKVWERSYEYRAALEGLHALKARAAAEPTKETDLSDHATLKTYQLRLVLERQVVKLWRSPSKTYHWVAFIGTQAISEMPYLIICGTLYFLCWYFMDGFPSTATISGHVYFQMILCEFLYTPIGQPIAAYAPNEYSASLVNPLVLGAGLFGFCGVVVHYAQINVFWRYWLYYLDPFTYLLGGLLGEVLWDAPVNCADSEWVKTDLPVTGPVGVT